MTTKRCWRWIGGLSAVLLGAGLTWYGLSYQRVNADPAPVTDAHDSSEAVACFGHVDVKHGVTSLCPTQAGRVAEVLVEEHQKVKAGDVMLRLDDSVARLRVREAQADLDAARNQAVEARKLPQQQEARLAQMRAGIEAGKKRLDAAKQIADARADLYAKNLIRKTEMDVARDQAQEAEALLQAEIEKLAELKLHDAASDVRRAEEEVKARQARLEQAQVVLHECELRAPADGKVLRILVGPGEMLGGPAKQAAVLFCPDGPRFIRAEVEQEFASRVKVGQAVVVRDDGNDPAVWHGRVTTMSDWYTQRRSILQEPLQTNDVRTIECLITLESEQPALRIGQRVRVLIENTP